MEIRKKIEPITQYSFLLLWGITIAVKLSGWEATKSEIALQSFPLWMEGLLLWGLPLVYISLIFLLLYKPTVPLGIRFSTIAMAIFTLYLLIGADPFRMPMPICINVSRHYQVPSFPFRT